MPDRTFKPLLVAAALMAAPAVAGTGEFAPAMQDYVETNAMGWVTDPVLVDAIRAQNERFASLSPDDILRMDAIWQAEVGQPDTPTIAPVVTGPTADFLRARIGESAGVISEVFIVDNHGLNVAASGTTSDYWQGDETKFTESYGRGAGAIHVGDVEFDESTQAYLGQVSIAISDPETGQPIGAITIGLNAEMLF